VAEIALGEVFRGQATGSNDIGDHGGNTPVQRVRE